MWVKDDVVVGLLGVRGAGKGETQNMYFGGVYTVCGISLRILFQGHSPEGDTVLLCLICYMSIGPWVGGQE